MKIVAHMMIRNEADVIVETLSSLARWGVSTVVVMDGGSDDGTIELVQDFADNRSWAMQVALTVIPDPGGRFADHRRGELLRLTRLHNPDWILSVDADEIYHTSPVDAIYAADAAGANVVWCDIPNFWITIADIKAGLLIEDVTRPVQERRRWYSWGHTGCFIWKDDPAHYYPLDVPKRTPEYKGVSNYREWQIQGPIRPLCKHYPFRSLPQAVKRMAERQARGGGRYFGKYYHDWIIDEFEVGLRCFEGDGWDTTRTHEAVSAYMGRGK